jgi:hypothetical protein
MRKEETSCLSHIPSKSPMNNTYIGDLEGSRIRLERYRSRSQSYYFLFKKWLSKTDIQAVRKQIYPLHSQTVQAIADKYEANRETIRLLRQTNKKAKYPWRTKYFYYIPLKKSSAMGVVSIVRFGLFS